MTGRSSADGQEEAATSPASQQDPVIARDADFIRKVVANGDRAASAERSRERTEKLINERGSGLCLANADLAALDLSGLDLRQADLSRAQLASADLSGADLRDATIICPLLERTVLRGADLRRFYGHALAMVSSTASGASLAGAIDCTGALFHGVDFAGADLSGGNFAGATFYQCDLSQANLAGASLNGAVFNECLLFDTGFPGAILDDGAFVRSQASHLDLREARATGLSINAMTQCGHLNASGAILRGVAVRRSVLDHGDFRGADLDAASFDDCSLEVTTFERSNLKAARLRQCTLTKVTLEGADLTEASLIDCAGSGVSLLGAKGENARFLRCALPNARFGASDAFRPFFGRGFTARDCNLARADFTGAYLYRAMITGDPVTGMILDSAKFGGVNLIQAYVAASLRGADLTGLRGAYARFNQSDLTGANLRGANLFEASLVKTKLSGACLTGVLPPFFLDRCPGLADAELESGTRAWVSDFGAAIRTSRYGST